MNVSACLVTRGDVDLSPIIDEIVEADITDIVVYDNSIERDVAVFGRYAAMKKAIYNLIYVQDDDVLVPAAEISRLVEAHEGGVTMLWPEAYIASETYRDSGMVGFGAVFEEEVAWEAFRAFLSAFPDEEWGFFCRRCDNVFTGLTRPLKRLYTKDVKYLPWWDAENRMFRQPEHAVERDLAIEKSRRVLHDHASGVRE